MIKTPEYNHLMDTGQIQRRPPEKLIMTVFGGIAEFERSLILSRTQEGRESAMARGIAFGRPSKLREDQKEVTRDLVKNGRSISAVARTFNVHPSTIYRCLDEKQSLCFLSVPFMRTSQFLWSFRYLWWDRPP